MLGVSANQENVSGSPATALKVNDQVFLRPEIVEGVLLQFGDLIAMRGGKIVEHGTRREIFENPRDEYTRALIAAVPIPDPEVYQKRAQAHA